jgi:T6SS, Phospholipase effector Tle1-like, catalytic domain
MQRVEEVWFAGSHSDVGGGNSNASLPDISLAWIAQGAREAGVRFEDLPSVPGDASYSRIHYMNSGFWLFLKPIMRTVRPGDDIHPSVYQRAMQMNYRPTASMPQDVKFACALPQVHPHSAARQIFRPRAARRRPPGCYLQGSNVVPQRWGLGRITQTQWLTRLRPTLGDRITPWL